MLETRSFPVEAEVSGRTFRGRSIVFNHPAELPTIDGSTITESIAPEAFQASLLERTPVLLHEHRPENLLARRSVKVTQSDEGIDVEAEFVDTPLANTVAALIRAKEIEGQSFGFMPAKGGFQWERRATGPHRTLRRGALLEISTVVLPVYSGTSANMRSVQVPSDLRNATRRDIQRWAIWLERKVSKGVT